MDVREELRSLTMTTPRAEADEGVAVYRRGQRRRLRRRVTTGFTGATAVVLAVLLAVVAWPGAGPDGLTIADQPDGPGDRGADLPDGWQEVRLGDAVFGVPGDREIEEVAPDEPPPCPNMDRAPKLYLMRAGYPSGLRSCRDLGASVAGIVAAPRSGSPAIDADQPGVGVVGTSVIDTPVGPVGLTDLGDHHVYDFRDLDLRLEFTHLDLEPGLNDAVVATVRRAGSASAEAPASDPTDQPTTEPHRVDDAGREFAVGGALVTVPDGFVTREVTPEHGSPCYAADTSPTVHVAPDGAPVGADLGTAEPCFQGGVEPPPATTTSVLLTDAASVPPAWLPGHAQEDAPAWEDVELGGAPAQAVEDVATGLYVVRSVALDLYLEVSGRDLGPELVEELLESIRPRGTEGAGAVAVDSSEFEVFLTPGSLPEMRRGTVIRDADLLGELWRTLDGGSPAPSLVSGTVALVAPHDLGDGPCRDEDDLDHVEVDGGTATLVFVPSLREPCITPGGAHTAFVVIPGGEVSDVEIVRAERR